MYYTCLIGKPTGHSVSHVLYDELIKAASVDHSYRHLKIDLERGELERALAAFKLLRFKGVSVTIPYKLAVIEYLDALDDAVREIGAVNTLK